MKVKGWENKMTSLNDEDNEEGACWEKTICTYGIDNTQHIPMKSELSKT